MKKIVASQGEVTIFSIKSIPECAATRPAERVEKGWIISHSESGNHHICTGGDVMERTNNVPSGMRILYAVLDNPAEFIQDAPTPHGKHVLPAGLYEFRCAREFNPFTEQARIVQD